MGLLLILLQTPPMAVREASEGRALRVWRARRAPLVRLAPPVGWVALAGQVWPAARAAPGLQVKQVKQVALARLVVSAAPALWAVLAELVRPARLVVWAGPAAPVWKVAPVRPAARVPRARLAWRAALVRLAPLAGLVILAPLAAWVGLAAWVPSALRASQAEPVA
jgi:hypothetical protein